MRSTPLLASASVIVGTALADTHYMFSGFFSGSTIVGLEFDDVASTLTLVNNITNDALASASKWIAINEPLNHLYVGTTGFFQSFAITSDLGLTYEKNVSLPSDCRSTPF